MSIDSGRGEQIVFDLLEVGVADTTGFDAHEDLAAPNVRRWHRLHGDFAFAKIHGSLHLLRNHFLTRR
jgi:hypothetical protein